MRIQGRMHDNSWGGRYKLVELQDWSTRPRRIALQRQVWPAIVDYYIHTASKQTLRRHWVAYIKNCASIDIHVTSRYGCVRLPMDFQMSGNRVLWERLACKPASVFFFLTHCTHDVHHGDLLLGTLYYETSLPLVVASSGSPRLLDVWWSARGLWLCLLPH